ncbi:MAG: hypothetical protein GY938_24470 [Ketobacter sp.]|nr:hypothetical protein [Ketobacter sp.]
MSIYTAKATKIEAWQMSAMEMERWVERVHSWPVWLRVYVSNGVVGFNAEKKLFCIYELDIHTSKYVYNPIPTDWWLIYKDEDLQMMMDPEEFAETYERAR